MTDKELEAWGKAWREQPAALVDLKRVTQRERNVLIAWIAVDAATALALLAFGGWLWLSTDSKLAHFSALALGAFAVAGLAFLASNWRHSFRSIADSAREHLELQRERARARLRYAEVSWVAFAMMTVFFAALLYVRHNAGEPYNIIVWKATTAATTVVVAAAIVLWIQLKARRRLRALDALARTLEEGNDDVA
jgi:hypothetical protein